MSTGSSSPPTIPAEQEALYGEWIRNQRWRDRLHRRTAHKALNVPDDDMDIRVKHGITWKELLALGALLAGAALGWQQVQPDTPATDPPAAVDTDTQYEFDVKAGQRQ
jgi:hypothetical protein